MYCLSILSTVFLLLRTVSSASTLIVPNTIQTGPSSAQFTSSASGLDAPKVNPTNATSFDWWYFDAVSADSLSSVVIVFYLSTDLGFPFLLPGAAVSVDIFVSFDDGTLLFLPVNDLPGTAGEATIVSDGDGASGSWANTGFSFDGSSDLSQYTVTIDSPLLGINGSLVLNSIAPAHYPCTPLEAGADLEVSPHIGWANAIPDSNAVADFTISGRELKFEGPGYHDKNWGDQPFSSNVQSWYWGHGRLGPYSIVWFDVIASDGKEYVSSYASLNNTIIASSCSGIKVRPTGANDQYPPVITSGNPDGFYIEMALDGGEVLVVNVTATLVVSDVVAYTRWIGTMVGGVRGEESYEGVALYEEFKLVA